MCLSGNFPTMFETRGNQNHGATLAALRRVARCGELMEKFGPVMNPSSPTPPPPTVTNQVSLADTLTSEHNGYDSEEGKERYLLMVLY